MKREFVVYRGKFLTIEWYFDAQGRSAALAYFEDLPSDRQKRIDHLFKVLGDFGKIFNLEKFRYEGDQIYALKAAEDRFLCFFFSGSKVIITNAYEKKSMKMPVREKQKALLYKAAYRERCQKGVYYV